MSESGRSGLTFEDTLNICEAARTVLIAPAYFPQECDALFKPLLHGLFIAVQFNKLGDKRIRPLPSVISNGEQFYWMATWQLHQIAALRSAPDSQFKHIEIVAQGGGVGHGLRPVDEANRNG